MYRTDLLSLSLITNPADDVDCLLAQYNSGIVGVMEKHAPLLRKMVTIRPDNPWNSEDSRRARRYSRKIERRWKARGLEIDGECLSAARDRLRQLISDAKVLKIVNTFLLKKPGLKLPLYC